MRYRMLLILLAAFFIESAARDMRSVWKSVPDTVVPGIDRVRRLEMLDLVDYRVKAEVNNRLGTTSVMDTVTADYLHITLSKSCDMSMRLLPTAEGDTLICMLTTFKAPEAESTICFYDLDWQRMDNASYLPFSRLDEVSDSLVCRPDSMPVDSFAWLCSQVVVPLVSARQTETSSDIMLEASFPMLSADVSRKIKAMLVSRRLVWDCCRYVWQ